MTDNNFPVFEEPEEMNEHQVEDVDEIFTGGLNPETISGDASCITVRSSNGSTRYIPTSEAMTVSAVMEASGLFTAGSVDYFLDGTRVNTDTIIPVNGTLTVIGSVKGG